MLRTSFKGLLALAVVGLFAAQANAGWHHHRWGSCGSSGGWYGSWGSSGGSWGSCGSSGGWYGSCGSSGGSWGSSGGSWGSSGGSWGSSGGGTYAPVTPTVPGAAPAMPPAPATAPAPTPTPPAPGAEPAPTGGNTTYHPTYGPERTSALLSVKVPADAKVFVNDRPTTSVGNDREYISRDLTAGAVYNYDVRAEFVRDGRPVSETKSVQLTAGQSANLDFNAAATAAAETRTTLTVHVPADAKLYLADHETQATGEVREFSTNRLAAGSHWATYAIKAVIERDGKPVVREETISLKAGESRDVTINFDEPAHQVATKTER